jgi:hypothetical protein
MLDFDAPAPHGMPLLVMVSNHPSRPFCPQIGWQEIYHRRQYLGLVGDTDQLYDWVVRRRPYRRFRVVNRNHAGTIHSVWLVWGDWCGRVWYRHMTTKAERRRAGR